MKCLDAWRDCWRARAVAVSAVPATETGSELLGFACPLAYVIVKTAPAIQNRWFSSTACRDNATCLEMSIEFACNAICWRVQGTI